MRKLIGLGARTDRYQDRSGWTRLRGTHRSIFQTGQAVDGKLMPWRAMLGRKPLALQIQHYRAKPYCLESA